MSFEPFYRPTPITLAPREQLYEFQHGGRTIRCELIDRGEGLGVEAQIFYDDEPRAARTFTPWNDVHRPPRESAIAWATAIRLAIEAKG